MVTLDDMRYLRDAVASLCDPLHLAFDKAGDSADGVFAEHGMDDPEFARELTEFVRALARKNLQLAERSGELGEWRVATSRNSGQTHLRNGMLVTKVLHVAANNLVPAPGSNQRRNAFYRNEQLQFFGVEASKLLALWWIDPKTNETSIRIVRPSGPWRYGERHICDVDFLLPRQSVELDSMEFTPDDSGFELEFGLDDDGDDDDIAHGW